MVLHLFKTEFVLRLHDRLLNENELQGLAGNKSLESVLARIENRVSYGLIHDVFDLAATYGVVLSVGHVFNDANKRTAMAVMEVCLKHNGVEPEYNVIDAADMIIQAAQGLVDDRELAQWLRDRCL